jgi:predicted nucleic acid-binding protein
MTGLLDTNVALYLLGGRLAAPLPAGDYGVSVITEMELLAWPTLTDEEEKKVRAFLASVTVCELTPAIRARAVSLRRVERIKLPDAIVCATAMEHGAELWTNDTRLARMQGTDFCISAATSNAPTFSHRCEIADNAVGGFLAHPPTTTIPLRLLGGRHNCASERVCL